MSPSEVYRALAAFYETPADSYGGEQVKRLRLMTDGRIEVVYSRPEVAHLIGLRIQVDQNRDDEVARVIVSHLGEPLGTFMDSLRFDDEGVGWWDGEPLEWWYS